MVSKARLRKMRSVSLPSHLTMKRCAVLLAGDWRMEAHKCDVAYADWDADWDTALAKVTKFAGTLPDPDRDFAGDWWVVLEGGRSGGTQAGTLTIYVTNPKLLLDSGNLHDMSPDDPWEKLRDYNMWCEDGAALPPQFPVTRESPSLQPTGTLADNPRDAYQIRRRRAGRARGQKKAGYRHLYPGRPDRGARPSQRCSSRTRWLRSSPRCPNRTPTA